MEKISTCGKRQIIKKSLRLLNKLLAVIYELGIGETATFRLFFVQREEPQATNVTCFVLGSMNPKSTTKLITLRYLQYCDNKVHPATLIQLINESHGCCIWQKEEITWFEIKHRRVSVESICLYPVPDSVWGKVLSLRGTRSRRVKPRGSWNGDEVKKAVKGCVALWVLLPSCSQPWVLMAELTDLQLF